MMTMTWSEYVELAARTDKAMPDNERKLHHALLLTTEYLEWSETIALSAEYHEEMGDMLWAIAAISRDYAVPTHSVFGTTGYAVNYHDLGRPVEGLASAIKADVVYDKDNTADIADRVSDLAYFLWSPEIGEANIAKLRARYPDKFDTGRAINRDTEKEMEAINATINTWAETVDG
jgi:hypothetical protein